MAFESLSEKLSAAFKKLRGKGRLTQADVREAMREVRMALLEADVSYKVVKDFVGKVQEKAVGQQVLLSVTPGQQMVKIVHDELLEIVIRNKPEYGRAHYPTKVRRFEQRINAAG